MALAWSPLPVSDAGGVLGLPRPPGPSALGAALEAARPLDSGGPGPGPGACAAAPGRTWRLPAGSDRTAPGGHGTEQLWALAAPDVTGDGNRGMLELALVANL